MESPEQIDHFLYGSILAVAFFVVLVGFIYMLYSRKVTEQERKFQLEMLQNLADSEEKQKEKIATNLHDEIVPMLASIVQSMDANNKSLENNRFDIERAKKDVESLAEVIKDVRQIAYDLIPSAVLSKGLLAALEAHIYKLKAIFDDETDFGENLPMSLTDQAHIFRMSLEILNNLQKHGKYKKLTVHISSEENSLILNFMHDGNGITNEEIKALTATSNGIGLKSIQSRALLLNATVDYSVESLASHIMIKMPFRA